jgi:transcriptional regulator with XRE-family HTH domain
MTDEHKPTVMERLLKARGDEIRQARTALGWSQAELAEKADTTQQTVDRIERGVTEKSKAAPKLRAILGLPPIIGDVQSTAASAASHKPDIHSEDYGRSQEENGRSFRDYEKIQKVAQGTHLPIYALSEEDKSRLISDRFADSIPRIYPVQNVDTAYGLISRDFLMEPVIRPGDIIIVNPNLPVIPQSEVVLSRKDGDAFYVLIRSLVTENEHSWTVENPHSGFETLEKSEWPRAELIVAKISRTR